LRDFTLVQICDRNHNIPRNIKKYLLLGLEGLKNTLGSIYKIEPAGMSQAYLNGKSKIEN